ncbi:YndM family protein [Domibacillus robiginosus]|uniref:YndM family protein n=1 Tax=Domibacillus robiginosus TaxID=1071054 RepID=UPI00067C85E1|nr:YndM family protein [Domibacillus robiginosus]
MDHVKALIIKFVMVAVVLGIVLTGIYDGEFSDTLLISAVLTVVAYVLGDLLVFRKVGDDHARHADHTKRNAIATVSDAVLAFFVVWLMGKSLFINDGDVLAAAFISAILIAAGEWFFHKYLDNHVFDEKHARNHAR